ncbi:MAG TPA: metal-dependent hydrolase [Candidatus Nanoarchaeia archaeon]|nr:metal-dependent hydrolase [Candidatus Nanoarchaeia archaeon]
MMLRTHMAIALFAVLLFVSHVNYKFAFVIVALAAAALPDADSAFSTVGRAKPMRILQFFVKHRSFIHSFTLAILLSLVFAFIIPAIALPFFLGYSLHVFTDAFTKEGIMPFWPWKKKSSGFVKTGGRIDSSVFLVFAVIDVILFFVRAI